MYAADGHDKKSSAEHNRAGTPINIRLGPGVWRSHHNARQSTEGNDADPHPKPFLRASHFRQ